MRLWSIHPKYLDAKGLIALWREGLLAQKVLQGTTTGYRQHPQLVRFKRCANPLGAIAGYLRVVAEEAEKRGYRFDRSKIARNHFRGVIPVSSGQTRYEFTHLLRKLEKRDPAKFALLQRTRAIAVHPTFRRVRGNIADWEIQQPPRR